MYRVLGKNALKAIKAGEYNLMKSVAVSGNHVGSKYFGNGKNGIHSLVNSVDKLFPNRADFPSRHIGPRDHDIVTMLDLLGFKVSFSDFMIFYRSSIYFQKFRLSEVCLL